MRFLVAGCGSIGKRHLSNLRLLSAGEVIAYDTVQERREEVSGKYGVKVFSDFKKAMQHRPDVVLVCTHTILHVDYAFIRCADNKKLLLKCVEIEDGRQKYR